MNLAGHQKLWVFVLLLSLIGTMFSPGNVAAATPSPAWTAGSRVTGVYFGTKSLTVEWPPATAGGDVSSYRIYRDGQSVGQSYGGSYRINDLSPGTLYTIRIDAVDAAGITSSLSADLRTVKQRVLAAGWSHSLLRQPNGTVAVWGANGEGQLGLNFKSATGVPTPVQIPNFTHVDSVTAGAVHSGALVEGHLYDWGSNESGQLGMGSSGTRIPQRTSESEVNYAAAGPFYTLLSISYGNQSVRKSRNGYPSSTFDQVPVSHAVAVAGGVRHYLALRGDGTVWAWGDNGNGGLGDGTYETRTAPVQVTGLTDVVEIAAGFDFSAALRTDGTVWTWGTNAYGILGNGSEARNSLTPAQVTGLSNITSIAAGDLHLLAVTADGSVWTWGRNHKGQLGDGSQTDRTRPVPVPGLTNVVAVAGGLSHSLALTRDGTVWAWGANDQGQLGDGTYESRLQPVRTLAPMVDTEPPTWPESSSMVGEAGYEGQVNLTWTPATDNLAVSEYRVYYNGQRPGGWLVLPAVTHDSINGLAPGSKYTFRVEAQDPFGNKSTGGPTAVVETAPPPHEQTAISQAAGREFSVAVREDGTVWAWGRIPDVGVGDDVNVIRRTPVRVLGLTDVTAVAAHDTHALALKTDGTVWAWGENPNGALGDGTTEHRSTPVQVTGLPPGIQAIAAGFSTSFALDSEGRVWAWGYLQSYEPLSPALVPGLSDVTALAAGSFRSLAIRADGTVWKLGFTNTGSSGSRYDPVQVPGLTNVTSLGVGDTHALAVKSDGTVWAWGDNRYGQLGDGTTTDRSEPVQVKDLTEVRKVAGGANYSLALRADGTLWGWGSDQDGQAGFDQTPRSAFVPTQVETVPQLTELSTGYHYTIVRNEKGVLFTFGQNDVGQLGVGEPNRRIVFPLLLPKPDTTAPWWSSTWLQVRPEGERSLILSWWPPEDLGGLNSYRIYKNGLLLDVFAAKNASNQDITNYKVTGLDPGTVYVFHLEAVDRSGNRSQSMITVVGQTAGTDKSPPGLARDPEGALQVVLAVQRAGKWYGYKPIDPLGTSVSFRWVPGDVYILAGFMAEPVKTLTVNGSNKGVELTGLYFEAPLKVPSTGAATFKLEAVDLVGLKGTIPVQIQGTMTLLLTEPTASIVHVGQDRLVQFSGTASEDLGAVRIVDDTNREKEYFAEVSLNGKQFTATLHLPYTERDTIYQLRVIGVGKDGFTSSPDAKGRDLRTVRVDVTSPPRPIVTIPKPAGDLLYVSGKTMTLKGTTEPGATVRLTVNEGEGVQPKPVVADKAGLFTISNVAITDGTTALTIVAVDAAGNESQPVTLSVIRDASPPTVKGLTLTVNRAGSTEELKPTVSGTTYAFTSRGAEAYSLTGSFSEALASVLIGGKATGIQLGEQGFTSALSGLKSGTNTLELTVSDLAGNTTKVKVTIALDLVGPTVTMSTPSANLLYGRIDGQTSRFVDFAGTANEKLKSLTVVDGTTGQAIDLPVTVTINPNDAKTWTARITVPVVAAAVWNFRIVGEDLAGNPGVRELKGKDSRTVTVDPLAPVLTLKTPPGLLFYTTKAQLNISGSLADGQAGIKQVMVDNTAVKPKGAVKSFDFNKTITLKEGVLTVIPVYGEDLAGNRSDTVLVRALLRTSIKTLTLKAAWSKDGTIKITGTTDKAVSVDGSYVAVVPLEITVKDKNNVVVRTVTLNGPEGAVYDAAKGTFAVTLSDLSDFPDGSYTVTVKATAPIGFPGLTEKVTSTNVTVKR